MIPIKEIPLHPGRTDLWSNGAENLAVHLTYDLSPFLALWPDAQPAVAFERADGQKYAHSWTLQDNTLHIPLLQADTALPGSCKCMISLLSGERLANTAVFYGSVTSGLDSLDEAPTAPEQGVIEQVSAAAAQAQQALDNMQARYYIPSVEGNVLTWQPTADDMPAVPAAIISSGSSNTESDDSANSNNGSAGVLFVHISVIGDNEFATDTSYEAIVAALQAGQMPYASLENMYYMPLVAIVEDMAIFSMAASLFGSTSLGAVIIGADGSITVDFN